MFFLKMLDTKNVVCSRAKQNKQISLTTKNIILLSSKLAFYLGLLSGLFLGKPIAAQQIIPNNDGTATVVTKDGQTFNISGGTLSKNGKNLFHSLQEFGLNPNQIANFLSQPNVQNILTRINGGNPSIINGLIQVSGGNSNLYLMNPSGIIFGKNASLNVPASFTATSATGIGLDGAWFEAFGNNNYQNLVGNPDAFKFTGTNGGIIINAGELKVAEEQNLSLVGGQVINLGTIEAPGGTITIAAVPGTSLIRISQEGQLLSLELKLARDNNGNIVPFEIADLPALLTGNPIETGLSASNSGEVKINNSDTIVPNTPATAIVSGKLDVSGNVGGEIEISGTKVGLIGANIDASGSNGGGKVLIGGDYRGEGNLPNAETTYVSADSVINADAINNGDGGKVIVWADETTRFHGNISATGGENSGDGGLAEVSGKENLVYQGFTDLRATKGEWGTLLLDPRDITIDSGPASSLGLPPLSFTDNPDISVTISNVDVENALNTANLIFQANNDIIVNPGADIITLGSGSLTLQAGKSIAVGSNISLNGGNFNATINDSGCCPNQRNPGQATFRIDGLPNLSPGLPPTLTSITTNGGSISITDGGVIIGGVTQTGNIVINAARLDTSGGLGTGTINLTANNSGAGDGISIENNSILTSANGNISLTGRSNGTGNGNNGIAIIENSTIESTGAGSIILNGTGSVNGTTFNDGILVFNSTVASENGTISLTGTGNGSGASNNGVQIGIDAILVDPSQPAGGEVRSTNGEIIITGTGGNGTNGNSGVQINQDATVTSLNGNITITGQGNGTTIDNRGIDILDRASVTSTNGTITLTGTGGTGTDNNEGIFVRNNSTISSAGAINLTGTGNGIGSINGNVGIGIRNNSTIQTTGTGTITLDGTGSINGRSFNDGITVFENSRIISENGTIRLTGTGNGSGDSNNGVQIGLAPPLLAGAEVRSTGGDIIITGTGGNGTNGNTGVQINQDANVTSLNGNITITGQGGGTGVDNDGINILDRGSVTSTNGTITLTGTSSPIGTNDSAGILVNNSQISSAGAINLTGTGNGIGLRNRGIVIQDTSSVTSTGAGIITLTGTSSLSGTDDNVGIFVNNNSQISSAGAINLTGTGNGIGLRNRGIVIQDTSSVRSTGAGIITLTGTAASGTDDSVGIFVNNNSQINSAGAINLTGRANGIGLIRSGIAIQNTSSVASTGNGIITLAGTAASGTDNIRGIFVDANSNISSENGNISLIGRFAGSGLLNRGIVIQNSSVTSTGAGIITLEGTPEATGSIGTDNNNGILVDTSTISSGGNISLSGTGNGSNNNNSGIVIQTNSSLTSTGAGTVTLNGTSASGIDNNDGILVDTSTISSGGNISLSGTGNGSNNNNDGIVIQTNSSLTSTGAGTVTLNGTNVSGIDNNDGILVDTSTISSGGNISLSGTSNGSGSGNDGIVVQTNSSLTSTGAGTVTLTGTGSINGINENNGVLVDTSTINSSGNISLTGTGSGSGFGNDGILIQNTSSLTSTGNGIITFTGTAASGIDENRGIVVNNSQILGSLNGDIRFNATSNGSGARNVGIFLADGSLVEASGTGNINLEGTGGNGTSENRGIEIQGNPIPGVNTSRVRSSDGNITLTGTGRGTRAGFGIFLNNGGIVESTGLTTGNISLTGTGANGEAGINIEDNSEILGNAKNITLTADLIDAPQIALSPQISGRGTLQLQPLNPNTRFALNSGISSAIQEGFSQIIIGRTDSVAPTVLTGNLTFSDPVNFLSPIENTATGGTIVGIGDASIAINPGSATFSTLNANIVTAGNPITLNNNVVLGNNVTIDTTNFSQVATGANIAINGTIDGTNLGTEALNLNAGSLGNITLSGQVGTQQPLANLTVQTANTVITGDINSNAFNINSSNITSTGNINSNQISILTNNNLTTNNLVSNGGNINLTSTNGAVTTGIINSSGVNVSGNTVSTTDINSNFVNINSSNTTNTGNINSNQISILTNNNLTTNNLVSNGGNISLTSTNGEVTTGNINSSGNSGGNILVDAQIAITTGAIDSSAIAGDAGNVTLDPQQDIQVRSINAQSSQGRGGTVDITTQRFFRATDTFVDRNNVNASISTAAPGGGGPIIIRHGGAGITPFVVSNAINNGTAGAITSGDFNLNSGSFLFTTVLGNISIISITGSPNPDGITTPQITTPVTPPPSQTRTTIATIEQAREVLQGIEREVGKKPALIYVNFVPAGVKLDRETAFNRNETTKTSEYENYLDLPERTDRVTLNLPSTDEDIMELLLVTPDGEPVQISVPATRQQVQEAANDFYSEVANFGFDYITNAEQMYDWIIVPIREQLAEQEIENLVFIMPSGLRLLPLAAMYDRDNQEFLVQQYSVGLAPSVNLIDFRYRNLQRQRVLAGGASIFEADQNQRELPAAAFEVREIATEIREGRAILNEEFTLANFQQAQRATSYPIVHLATHADFQEDPQQTYLQFYDRKLSLKDFRELGLQDIDLMVISACRSAYGDRQAELGFGGLAVQAGVKSALASLWYVGDVGSFTLMAEFYRRLGTAEIKADALRQTQIDMIEENVRQEGNQIVSPQGNLTLPETIADESVDLTHPYYWAAFTTIGSPW